MPEKTYHDYVIKDGELVGKFEEMYQECTDILPWRQDKTAFAVFSDIDIAILKHYSRKLGISSIHEVGCGLGFFTDRMRRELGSSIVLSGEDVSATAIDKAKSMFPDIDFIQHDLSDRQKAADNTYDLVVMKSVLWYILDNLDEAFDYIYQSANKYFFMSQSFPNAKTYLGRDRFPGSESLCEYVSEKFSIIYQVTERDREHGYRELVHILAEKKI